MDSKKVVDAMTLEEKIKMISGKDFWHLSDLPRFGIPAIMLTDGPHGLRKQAVSDDHLGIGKSVPAVSFPTAVNLASSWDPELVENVGRALGTHCVHENVSVLLGPGVNIKRSPLCGRNFEYFSEDPLLTGHIAAAWIKGVQSQGAGTSIKHYALNNQETRRMTINVLVDERAMHEIYLAGFKYAVEKVKPHTVMSAYNQVNGQYASENECLIEELLRNRWGFNGIVVSDWGATNDRVDGLNAGLDLEMPGSSGVHTRAIKKALKRGSLSIKTLDQSVLRILELIRESEKKRSNTRLDLEQQHNLAGKVAAESLVLLKNVQNTLPLNKKTTVAVIGSLAKKLRYQGSGSSRVNPTKLPSILDILKQRQIFYEFQQGYFLTDDHCNEKMLNEAIQVASKHNTIIVFAGLPEHYESEGFDREHLNLPAAQNRLIEELSRLNKKMVVVLLGGSPVIMPWLNKAAALLNSYLPGQAGAEAIIDVLYGDVNPSGRLAETYPLSLADTPCYTSFACEKHHQPYLESIYVGYRYYDTAKKEVLFPFGYGLGYTTFSYHSLSLSAREITDSNTLDVEVTISNDGKRSGKEVVQLYVSMPESKIFREAKSLRAFKKINLQPGQKETVTFTLDRKDFAYYNPNIADDHVETGTYEILVGSSSRHIHHSASVFVQSTEQHIPVPEIYQTLKNYHNLSQAGHSFTVEAFKQLYEKPYPEEPDREYVTINTPVYDMQHHFIGRKLYKMIENQARKMNRDNTDSSVMVNRILKEIPLRSIVYMSQGKLSLAMADGLVDIINGKTCKGLCTIFKGMIGI